ncbi:hypothetical protein O0L34_g18046 [Tuta absoluta]|nr:hypothetical protein O0L34_g18046 [Tuta absoluta]
MYSSVSGQTRVERALLAAGATLAPADWLRRLRPVTGPGPRSCQRDGTLSKQEQPALEESGACTGPGTPPAPARRRLPARLVTSRYHYCASMVVATAHTQAH